MRSREFVRPGALSSTWREYLERVADGPPWSGDVNDGVDADICRLLRLYNQLSILLESD